MADDAFFGNNTGSDIFAALPLILAASGPPMRGAALIDPAASLRAE